MIVLGIETSCDETAAAVVDHGHILSNIVASQMDHIPYGGVVPELASRAHERNITPIIREAIAKAGIQKHDIEGVAVTYGPGLAGALAVGLSFAKALSQALDIPLIGVDHMEGHLWANYAGRDGKRDGEPHLCLLVSGGHTHLWQVNGPGEYILLGRTLDDAAGEAFDKGARLMGLAYPGGPAIQEAAVGGDPKFVDFPRPMLGKDNCDFSFSGLKTALLYYLRKMNDQEIEFKMADIAASYQAAIVDTLLDRMQKAVKKTNLRKIFVAGGVTANRELRVRLDQWRLETGIEAIYPPLEYCTDNAAMIALAGAAHLEAGEKSSLNLGIFPNLSLADHARY